MMKLSLMKKIVETVDGKWRSPLAETILNRWGFDEGTLYYYRASANFIFIFKKDGITRFLRFNDSAERDLGSIESEIAILLYLQNTSVSVVQPVKSSGNQYIEVVETELGTFNAVVFEALPGKHLEIDELDGSQFFKWGSALGQLHHILKSIPEEYRLKRPNWKDHLIRLQDELSVGETVAMLELERVINWADQIKLTKEDYGIIHYDFELDNLKWDHDTIGILDFDECANYPYVADIAYALRDLIEEKFERENPAFQAFLNGYSSETGLNLEHLDDIEWFIRLHKIVTFTRLLRAVDIPDSPENPEWLTNLRKKLITKMENYRQSLALR